MSCGRTSLAVVWTAAAAAVAVLSWVVLLLVVAVGSVVVFPPPNRRDRQMKMMLLPARHVVGRSCGFEPRVRLLEVTSSAGRLQSSFVEAPP